MFNKQQNEQKIKETETIIGSSVKVKGNFHGQGNIVIEGIVEGNIKTNSSLYVGEQAKITANIEAKEARISGEINGNIIVRGYLEITSKAKVVGDIEAPALSIERGATLNGKCTMNSKNKNSDNNTEKETK